MSAIHTDWHTFSLTYNCPQRAFQPYLWQLTGPQDSQAFYNTRAPVPSLASPSDFYIFFFLQSPSNWCYSFLKPFSIPLYLKWLLPTALCNNFPVDTNPVLSCSAWGQFLPFHFLSKLHCLICKIMTGSLYNFSYVFPIPGPESSTQVLLAVLSKQVMWSHLDFTSSSMKLIFRLGRSLKSFPLNHNLLITFSPNT